MITRTDWPRLCDPTEIESHEIIFWSVFDDVTPRWLLEQEEVSDDL